jgi:hypothetical protein
VTRPKEKNPYDVLKINEDASDQEITKHFRDLARELHPDNGTRPNEEEFKEISGAYERLTRNRKLCDEQLAQARRKAEADRRAKQKEAVRQRRRPSSADVRAYGERLRGESGGRPGKPSSPRPKAPPQTPPPKPPQRRPQETAVQPPMPTAEPVWRRVSVELAVFLLVLLGCLVPPGIIVLLGVSGNLKNPSFGVAVIGFFCSIACLVSVVGIFGALGSLSGRAFGVLVSLCVGGFLAWRLVTANW